MTALTKRQQAERAESVAVLRAWLPIGSTVRLILRHVSRSGMARDISPIALVDGDERYCAYHVARVLPDYTTLKHAPMGDACRVQGCGMDMGFDLVYHLAYALYGDGYALKHRWL